MRHTAISMYLAKHKDEGEAASWAGNSPNVIHRHYKGPGERSRRQRVLEHPAEDREKQNRQTAGSNCSLKKTSGRPPESAQKPVVCECIPFNGIHIQAEGKSGPPARGGDL